MMNIDKAVKESPLKLHGWKIKNIDYKYGLEDDSFINDSNVCMQVNSSDINEDNTFDYLMKIKVESDKRIIELEVMALFEIKAKLSEEEKKKIVELDGTKVLYPYVRSAMSIMSGLDGSFKIDLPIINVETLLENGKEDK